MGYKSLLSRIHPEAHIDGFTQHDSAVKFYSLVHAAMLNAGAKRVLDFGAGRGAFWYINTREKGSLFRKKLRDLRTENVHVTACDVSPVVKSHPCSHRQVVIDPEQPLPFEDQEFDVVVTDMTFEHVDDPDAISGELLRVVKKGGYILARTPNKWGYVALAASLVPNSLHTKVLSKAQPRRAEMDVFPTRYKLNTKKSLQKHFSGASVKVSRVFVDPAYHFNSVIVFQAMRLLHWLLPPQLAPVLFVLIRK